MLKSHKHLRTTVNVSLKDGVITTTLCFDIYHIHIVMNAAKFVSLAMKIVFGIPQTSFEKFSMSVWED